MTTFPPIAVVGRACLLPGASSPEELWSAVVEGRDLVTAVPADRWGISHDDVMCDGPEDSTDRTWSDRGGYVDGFSDLFDAEGFRIPARDIDSLDPVFQWTLHVAREALQDSGHADSDPARFGAVFGNLSFPSAGMAAFTQATLLASITGCETGDLKTSGLDVPDPRNRFNSGLPALILERALGLGVGALALDAACASSLYAIKLACDRLHDGEADLMLAGAVNCADDLCIHLGFAALTALSRTGRSRPFHADADGLVPAEGCGFVALRRLEDAVSDGDTIHGVIRGVGLSNDGRGRGMLVPSRDGQTIAMSRALEMSGLSPADVSLLECHATGTQVGDETELRASSAVYDGCSDVPIGSLKSNMGHLITAAGVAGLIKVLEAMRHEVRPPTLHAEKPLDALSESPFRLLDVAENWDRVATSDGVLRAGVSAFGFGGNNAHLIVEEPSQNIPAPPDASEPDRGAPIAIVGIGVTAASAIGRTAFTEAILGETSCLNDSGEGVMSDISLLVKNQKFPPIDLEKTLAQQTAMLQVGDEAISDSGILPSASTGVYVGMGTDPEAARFGLRWRIATIAREWGFESGWVAEARDAIGPPLDAARVMGTMPNIVANRLNSQFDLAGPSFTVSSEERSGLDALVLAARALRVGEIDAALVGAVDLSCQPVHRAASAACLTSDGQPLGDAAVMLVLKRLDDAESDGNTVYAILPAPRQNVDVEEVESRSDVVMGAGSGGVDLSRLFGHSHVASGLVHVAAAALALHHRVLPGDVPLLASNPEWGSGLQVGVGPRTISVEVEAMDGISRTSALLAEAGGHLAPSRGVAPRLHIFSGQDASEVLGNLADGVESDVGPARLVIVAGDDQQLAERSDRARLHIDAGNPPGEGVHFRQAPLDGEMGFVFTAAGAAYKGMGTELLRAIPELVSPLAESFRLGDVAQWVFDEGDLDPTPGDYLWGTSLLSQAHARLTRDVLKLKPEAAIGYSSGESNSLYAFGVWSDMELMRRDIEACGMMDRELGGEFAAVARAWGAESVRWEVWNVLAPVDDVREAIADESHVHLSIISTANDVIISGDAVGCSRVIEILGRRRCVPVHYNLVCHTPEVAEEFHRQWVEVHTRTVTPAPGIRHYSNGLNAAYEVSTEACADAITLQAESTLDFPATIEAAYVDGVRIFIEHGPAGACTKFVSEILHGRDFLAVQLDRRGKGVEQIFDAVAALVCAGVAVDHLALSERLTPHPKGQSASGGLTLELVSHAEPVRLPPHPNSSVFDLPLQIMEPAPELPSVLVPISRARTSAGETSGAAAMIQQQMAEMAEIHQRFVEQQAEVHEQFLQVRSQMLTQVPAGHPDGALSSSRANDDLVSCPSPIVSHGVEPDFRQPTADAAAEVLDMPGRIVFHPSGPTWDHDQLRIHSSGKISDLFGPMFEPQDHRAVQCRMPEPPLLLADRVTGIAATPGVLGRGTIWTETDVESGSWYLNAGYMPAGFMIESGQADLMLISYMGIDLVNETGRAYRLLGCTLTYHDDLPSAGETLQYEIRINGHASHGDIRLFFFEYDCIVEGERRLTVRDAQAGFFNAAELEAAGGILWTAEDNMSDLDPGARVDAPTVTCTKSSFSREDVVAFSEGRVLDCFGPGYEWTQTHTRTPKIQSGRQLFIDEITQFDSDGGPWGRGFMRCETVVSDDAWFFDGHFKNDPCMPGNFMVEACIEAISFYLAALGFTAQRDGWRFQPIPEQPFELKCRGEINPLTDRVVYEVHVEEVWSGPHPTAVCDVVGIVDGRPAFHAHRIGVELVPDWPLTSMPELYRGVVEPAEVATGPDGFRFDWKAMISCALGRPSEAFGPMYEIFDGTRRPPRLPGAPYHFISRVVSIEGVLDDCRAGMEIECEYDIPDDVWYFDENGSETMPFAVLLEAALQPCGWVASAVGSANTMDDDVLFRNLDGTGTVLEELTRTSGTLTTKVKLTNVSRAGGMIIESFDVECAIGDRVVYTMDTVFGFFPLEAFEAQVGLAVDESHLRQLRPDDATMVDLTLRPDDFCSGSARLADSMLLMLDRATHIANAGEAGLGVVRGEKDVDVSEWFFKAHFFQDPVQPGSLGIEALLQLLQFYMLDTNMADGLTAPRFEALMLDAPLSWKYRGQVTPKNKLITSVMEITEIGTDDRGPYVIGSGSLWCDGLRIYEVVNMGMRLVAGPPEIAWDAPTSSAEVPLPVIKETMRSYWPVVRHTPSDWLGSDLLDGLVDRYVNRLLVPDEGTFEALRDRSVIFLANHQVQIESLLISNLLPALTGVSMTTVANAKHKQRWIGGIISALDGYPGCQSVEQIAYFDQSEPATMFDLIDGVRQRMAAGPHSLFVHTDGTRSKSCREPTARCSSVFLDLALELDIPIVPVRFTGGLPVEPIDGKAEFPFGHGSQDYWIGAPIEADELRSMGLRDRVRHVVAAINDLGVPNKFEAQLPRDPEFAASVDVWQEQSGSSEVFAAAWRILEQLDEVSEDTRILREAAAAGYESDGSDRGNWLGRMAELFSGSNETGRSEVGNGAISRTSLVLNRSTHPHLIDHSIVKDGQPVPVVPVAYALEWFARAALAHAPNLHLRELSDLQVLKGLVLDDYVAGGDLLLVLSARTANVEHDLVTVDMNLVDELTGRPRYRCTALLGPVPATPMDSIAGSATLVDGRVRSTQDEAPYQSEVLFHGPAFRVISHVSPSPTGSTASLIGIVDAGWPSEPWAIDPAMLDGVLQMALLWSERQLGGPSLPTRIGSVRIFGEPQAGPIGAELMGDEVAHNRVRSDAVIWRESGEIICEISGIETHQLPRAGRVDRS